MSKRAFKTPACQKMSEEASESLSIGRQLVGAFLKRACQKKNQTSVNGGMRNLRVGVRAKNAGVSGFACRPF